MHSNHRHAAVLFITALNASFGFAVFCNRLKIYYYARYTNKFYGLTYGIIIGFIIGFKSESAGGVTCDVVGYKMDESPLII